MRMPHFGRQGCFFRWQGQNTRKNESHPEMRTSLTNPSAKGYTDLKFQFILGWQSNRQGMYLDDTKSKNKTKNWIRITYLILFVIFVFAFRNEIWLVVQACLDIFKKAIGREVAVNTEAYHALIVLFFNLIILFIPSFFIMAFFVSSQSLLPVSNFTETVHTMWHLILHMLDRYGPAIFIKDGKAIETDEDKLKEGLGVIVVDFNSAIVLEERYKDINKKSSKSQLSSFLGFLPAYQSPRAAGPGIAFTRPGERVRGIVDLRKQTRSRIDVSGYTRDGIELKTIVFNLFTIGQDPDVLQVTYAGDRAPENLRVLQISRKPADPRRFNSLQNRLAATNPQADKQNIEKIKTMLAIEKENFLVEVNAMEDELDQADRLEIHQAALEMMMNQEEWKKLSVYQDLPINSKIPVFNEQRVFSAVFSQARGDQEALIPWEDLPVQVGVDSFREILSLYNFDQLFNPEENLPTKIPELKNRLRIQVRNSGILSYRLLFDKTRRLLTSGVYRPDDLRVSEIRNMRNIKVLRERGIKVVACGFTALKPSEAIFEQRLNSWQAKWQTDTQIAQASHELEAMRIRNKARAQAQRELMFDLNQILKGKQPRQVLALKIMDSLEKAASNPKTRDLLPRETLELMRNLQRLLQKPN